MKKAVGFFLSLVLIFSLVTPAMAEGWKPEKDINVAVMWGAGGAADTSMRALAPILEEILGVSVIVTNRTGGGGAIAMQYVNSQPADGYNILCGSEGGYLTEVIAAGDCSLETMSCLNIYGKGTGIVLVAKDSPINTLEELIDYVKANPGKVTMSSGGATSSPYAIYSMMKDFHDIDPVLVTYDGDNSCVVALMGGEVEFTACNLVSAAQYVQSGEVKPLAIIANERLEDYPDVPAITEIYEGYNKYLPWNLFWGLWLNPETPEEIVAGLREAVVEAVNRDEFKSFMKSMNGTALCYVGEEAEEFAKHYQAVTAWLLYDQSTEEMGVLDPSEFGIEKIYE